MIDFNDALARQAPPSEEDLARARRGLAQRKAVLERRRRQIVFLSWAGVCLGFILLGVSLYFGWPGGLLVFAGLIGVVAAKLLFEEHLVEPLNATDAALAVLEELEAAGNPYTAGTVTDIPLLRKRHATREACCKRGGAQLPRGS